MADILPEHVHDFIKTIAVKNSFEKCEIKAKSMTTAGANYMGDLYVIDLVNDDESLNIFAKVLNMNQNTRQVIPLTEMQKREVFIYETLQDTIRSLEDKHSVPEEFRYKFPKYYGSDCKELEEVIVLDNLTKQGYVVNDRRKSFDWEFAKAAIVELAKYHALSYALEKDNPKKFKELIKSKVEIIIQSNNNSEVKEAYFKKKIANAFSVMKPKYIPIVQKFRERFQEFTKKIYDTSKYSVLVHGDFRISNILVKYEEDKLTSLIPIDYQTISYGSPINDLLYLLFSGSDEQFRKQHFEDYIKHYHDSLAHALQRFSLNIDDVYPRSIFYHHLREKLLYGLYLGIFSLVNILVEPGKEEKLDELFKGTNREVAVDSFYQERLNGIIDDMLRWGVLE